MINLKKVFLLLSLLLALTVLMVQPQQARQAVASGGGFPSVKGAQIFDGTNRPLQYDGIISAKPAVWDKQW